MSIIDLRRRLDRIEARRDTGRITVLANLAGHPPDFAAEAVANWRTWVADGRASRSAPTLYLQLPRLTVPAWVTAHAPAGTSSP